MDSVIRNKPAFVKRNRDYMMLCTTDTISQLVSGVKYMANQFEEKDGGITLSLIDMDIVSYGADLQSAKESLVQDIIEYAEDYYSNFELYVNSPNRKAHLPYVMKALTAKTPKELEDAVVCQTGKN